ncbi:MAG TPA: oligosaccharide flippase family protein [Acidobacteriota bacterium]|nr:oligosaccharide flippase family protein [Acidobacteriota bacterium]
MYLKRVLSQSSVLFAATIVDSGLGYVFRLLLARQLTLGEYGLFYSLFAFFSFFILFVDLGFKQALPKYVISFLIGKDYAKAKGALLVGLRYFVSTALLLASIFFLFAKPIISSVFKSDNTLPYLLMLLWFASYPIELFLRSLFLSQQSMTKYAILSPTSKLFTIIFTVIGFSKGFHAAPFMAYALANLCLLALFFIPAARLVPWWSTTKADISKETITKLFTFSGYAAFISLCWVIITNVNTVLLTALKDSTQAGLYQIALPLASLLTLAITPLNSASYPLFFELYAKKAMTTLRDGANTFYKYIVVGLLPIALALISFPEVVIDILFGAEYIIASNTLQILTIGTFFFCIASFNIVFLCATGREKRAAATIGGFALINLALSCSLIFTYGAIGVATASAISFLLLMLVTTYYVNKYYGATVPAKSWMLTIIIAIALVFFTHYAKEMINLNIWIKIPIIGLACALIYVGALLLTRIVDIKEITFFVNTALSKDKQKLQSTTRNTPKTTQTKKKKTRAKRQ